MRAALAAAMLWALAATSAQAAVITFDSNPFAGSDALSTPGRQIVLGEPSIVFDPASDVFAFAEDVFGISSLSFVRDLSANLPGSGANVIAVLDGAPLAAGTAANAIAAQVTESRPGFFVYFNTALDLPRLVFSTDLSDDQADLAVLARISNLVGPAGAALPFTASNFTIVDDDVPEPAALGLLGLGLLGITALRRRLA